MRLSPRTLALGLALGLSACGGSSSSFTKINTPPPAPLATGPQGTRVADAALAAGNPTLALQWTNSILAGNPRNVDALLRNGQANMMLNNATAAEASFRKVLSIDSSQSEARVSLAKLVMGRQPAEAEKMFQAVIADEPNNVGALNNYGVCLDLQGRHADAQVAYRKALAMAPELASARQNLGLSLALSGSSTEGVTMLGDAAQGSGGDRRARDNLALALAVNGRTDEAGKMLREELNPQDASAALAGYRALADDRDPAPKPAP